MKSQVVSTELDQSVLRLLKAIADEEGQSISWLVSLAVKQLISQRAAKLDVLSLAKRPP